MAGKLYVVGIGPGSHENMTIRAAKTLEECDCIAGYTVYCDLVRPDYPEKEYLSTPMLGEEKRVRLALEKADAGHTVALICSGDAGVYGLAGLALGTAQEFPGVEVEIVPGVTAALSGAALLGAPLIHDFCLISLSDRLTAPETIEKRLTAAVQADLAIVLYNPESRTRSGYLKKACDLLLPILGGDRICGMTKQIGREGEQRQILTLEELRSADADMFTTVFIGNSHAVRMGGRMVTPRGYRTERTEGEQA